ncbi:MAG: AAA family ATPase [Candidatus Hatepunaea meridiana]|nr:AAA family ATPase [Candidatus Hatepunaea meridiana]
MLLQLKASGFKSLMNFETDFKPGLNVLIGPNGSGKTTVCQAIGLISAIVKNEVSDYILSIGGAQSTFTRCKVEDRIPPKKITLGCTGSLDVEVEEQNRKSIKYEYKCTLELTETLSITQESLIIYYLANTNRFRILLKAKRSNNKFFEVKVSNKEELEPNFLSAWKNGKIKYSLSMTESFFGILLNLFLYYVPPIREDIANIQLFNINPRIAKKPSDFSAPSYILENGRYLSNALAKLENNNKDVFIEINDFLSQICPRYSKIIPETDNQKLMRTFSIIDHKGITCPASSLSDGTIKTIALLTAIHARQHATIVIEEPENYLHP